MGAPTGPGVRTAPDSNENLMAVCIDNGTSRDEDIEYLCEITVPEPKRHYDEDVSVVLMRGGFEKQTDRVIDTFGNDRQRVMVTDDATRAVGYYLQLLEIHDIGAEDRAREGVKNCAPDLFEEYSDWVAQQTIRDRRLQLLDQAEHDSNYSEFYTPVLEHEEARWRETGLSGRNVRRAKKGISNAGTNPKFCYQNARRVVREFWDDDSVQYVEGIALPKHAARIVGHAWVEFENRVAEVTWPWHQPNPDDTGAVYYGVEIPRETIEENVESHNGNDPGPLLLNVDDLSKLG